MQSTIFAIFTAASVAGPAGAALVRWDAQGAFGVVFPGTAPPVADLEVGDTVTVSMTFDTLAFAGSPVPLPTGQGTEYFITPDAFSIAFPDLGLTLTAEQLVGGTPEFIVSVADNTDAISGSFEDIIAVNVYRAGGAIAGGDGVQFTWAAFAPTSFLSGTAIPTVFDFSDFDGSQIVLSNAADDSFHGGGTLSSFTSIIVPTPAPAALLLLGVAARSRRA